MNTPSHYILNLVVLSKTFTPNASVAITLGAILPDVPIFVFYFVAKWVYRLPEREIWSTAYYSDIVQFWVSVGHSFPVAIAGLLICLFYHWTPGIALFGSMIGHSLLDFPFHHDDAHRHFFPLSDYKFISPLSYWDIKHHARSVACVEMGLVLAATPWAIGILNYRFTQGLVLAIDLLYVFAYTKFYLLR